MLFAAEQEVSNRNSLVRESGDHQLGLAGRHDFVIRALKKITGTERRLMWLMGERSAYVCCSCGYGPISQSR
jgi:hypothetical protein